MPRSGRLLDELERLSIRDDTIVVLWSDYAKLQARLEKRLQAALAE